LILEHVINWLLQYSELLFGQLRRWLLLSDLQNNENMIMEAWEAQLNKRAFSTVIML